jgi:hypothetical protein
MKTSKEAAMLRADADLQNARAALTRKRDEMIASVAETVSRDWYRRCVRVPQTMTLWWRKPRAGESAALPIIDAVAPSDEWQAGDTITAAMSRGCVELRVGSAMRNLPMLGAQWFTL